MIKNARSVVSLFYSLGKLTYLLYFTSRSCTELVCRLCGQVIKLQYPPTSRMQIYTTCAVHVMQRHPTILYTIRKMDIDNHEEVLKILLSFI